MRIVVMGCGRVGEQLCRLLVDEGHQVAVIDYDPQALARLGPNFKGRKVIGVGFDREVLIEAGIEQAEAFAAASASDNTNIVAARIARLVFRVPRVVARLYDPRRAEIYARLGLLTISSTTWGAERIRELLLHSSLDPTITFGNGEVCILAVEVPSQLIGRTVRNVNISGEINIVAISRQGQAFIPLLGAEFQAEDVLHVAILASAMARFKAMLGLEEGE